MVCLNCSAQLYIELPPGCVNFQCCACYAVHKVMESDPARAADENRKRKRKDRKGTTGYEPRELTAYNKYMRDQLAAIKEANPSLSHRDAFKLASSKVNCGVNVVELVCECPGDGACAGMCWRGVLARVFAL